MMAIRGGLFWLDRTPVTDPQFGAFVNATNHVTMAEKTPDRGDYPGAPSHMLQPGSPVFAHPPAPAIPEIGVGGGVTAWVPVGGSPMVSALLPEDWRPSGGTRRLRLRRLCAPGWEGLAAGGRRGIRRARRARGCRIRLGLPDDARGPASGQYLAGTVPGREHRRRRLRAHLPDRDLPCQWLRSLRHDRQCMGVDHRLVVDPPRGRGRQGLLRA